MSFRTAMAIAPLLGALLLGASSAERADAGRMAVRGGLSFCDSPPLRDYELPLRSLPPIEGLPADGQLPFAPPTIEASSLRPLKQRLLFPGSPPLFQLRNRSEERATTGWTIKVLVSRFTSEPIPISETATGVKAISPGEAIRVAGSALAGPGLFRIDISFLDGANRILGTYGEYVRAVRPRLKVKLGLKPQILRPGGTVRARLENLGTQAIGYSRNYILERFDGGHWSEVPRNNRKRFPLAFVAPAGMAGRCQPVHIPRNAEPGIYRVRVPYQALLKAGRKMSVTSYLRVRSP